MLDSSMLFIGSDEVAKAGSQKQGFANAIVRMDSCRQSTLSISLTSPVIRVENEL
ncbi:MAG TPA: hypothetical protein VJ695_11175 [Nitrososphaera sp.]|nr:hypothetical protein [Nitrososphaera sp.]